jgi:pyruvate,orthophosphate dikinase
MMPVAGDSPTAKHSGSSPGIYAFDHDHGAPARELVNLLGSKGAGLAEMTAALGINVPPGFTVSLPVCREYRERGWPAALDTALTEHVARLGDLMDRRLGDADDPLLVAVRSGAPVSMPGMLDTVLNLGLNDETVLGLARRSGDDWFAWDSYRRFLRMFATTVMGVPAQQLEIGPAGDTAEAVRDHVARLRERINESAGRPVPMDPSVQLRDAVEAVFRSWDCDRARAYRAKEGIDEQMGTAVNVQAMVFGNRGPRSGTGVVFTRDPATGEPAPYGDYLPRAQGEDVVAGTARTLPINHLGEHQPDAYAELLDVLRRLEVHYRDVCDVEFTLEEGKLWLLQTRVGKRGAVAAVRIAVDLVDDPDIRLDPAEAVDRVPPDIRERARQEILARVSHCGADGNLLGTGLGASPGRVSGRVVLSSEEAADADGDVVLVRPETSPEDVVGMASSVGVLTTRGGLVSHAAVVARGWGIPAVVGATDLTVSDGAVRSTTGLTVRPGEVITIDGTTGQVWRGEVAPADDTATRGVEKELPHLATLDAWATQHRRSTRMKITVDRTKCTSLGICESLAPEYFEVDQNGELAILHDDVPAEQRVLIEQAVAGCPTAALAIEDD